MNKRSKSEVFWFFVGVIVCALLMSIQGCASDRVYKDDNTRIYVRESTQVSPVVFKAKVEYVYPKTDKREERREQEHVKLDCQKWEIAIYDRIIFDKDGRIIGMSQFNVNNEFIIKENTLGAVLFGHFCIK